MKIKARVQFGVGISFFIAILLAFSGPGKVLARQTLGGMADQQSGLPMPSQQSAPMGPMESADPRNEARMQQQRLEAASNDRHKRLATDADKLLALATELKADVDKASKNETSVSAYQKANEIEKLAHDVKERLKN